MSADGSGPSLYMSTRLVTGPDGQFAFRNVPPGACTLQAFGPSLNGEGNLGSAPFGYLTFKVGPGEDASRLTVRIPPPRTLRGHITYEPDSAVPCRRSSRVFVSTRPVELESAPSGGGPSPFTVHDDGSFEDARHVGPPPGPRRCAGLVPQERPRGRPGCHRFPLDLREHDVNDVEIVLTTHATTLQATLAVPKGRAVSDYNLLVFAADDTKWAMWSRYVTVVRPNPQGAFTFRGLPAGSYIAVVVGTVAGAEWQDPEYLRTLLTGGEGVPFLLGDGESKTLALTARR